MKLDVTDHSYKPQWICGVVPRWGQCFLLVLQYPSYAVFSLSTTTFSFHSLNELEAFICIIDTILLVFFTFTKVYVEPGRVISYHVPRINVSGVKCFRTLSVRLEIAEIWNCWSTFPCVKSPGMIDNWQTS